MQTTSRACPGGKRGLLPGGLWLNSDSLSFFLQAFSTPNPRAWGPGGWFGGKRYTGSARRRGRGGQTPEASGKEPRARPSEFQ